MIYLFYFHWKGLKEGGYEGTCQHYSWLGGTIASDDLLMVHQDDDAGYDAVEGVVAPKVIE